MLYQAKFHSMLLLLMRCVKCVSDSTDVYFNIQVSCSAPALDTSAGSVVINSSVILSISPLHASMGTVNAYWKVFKAGVSSLVFGRAFHSGMQCSGESGLEYLLLVLLCQFSIW